MGSRCTGHKVGHPGEVLGGGGLDDQLATRQRVEERGLGCGSWLDLEELGDLGDYWGRDDDWVAETAGTARCISRGAGP
jgi:hypothetical protein